MPRNKFEGGAAKSLREAAPAKKIKKPAAALERAASVRPASFTQQEEDWFAEGKKMSKANELEAAKMVMPRSPREQYEAALEKQAQNFRAEIASRLNKNLAKSHAAPTIKEALRGSENVILEPLSMLGPSMEEARVAMGKDKAKAYETYTTVWTRLLDGLFTAAHNKQSRMNIEDAMEYMEKLMAAAKANEAKG